METLVKLKINFCGKNNDHQHEHRTFREYLKANIGINKNLDHRIILLFFRGLEILKNILNMQS